MKKSVLLVSLGLASVAANAQKSNIQSALNFIKFGELDKAKEAIDAASTNESTSSNPKTWYVKGLVYQSIEENPTFSKLDPNPVQKAYEAYTKAWELDPKYEKQAISDYLQRIAYHFYNDGVVAYNNKNYDQASKAFNATAGIFNLQGGTVYKGYAQFDSVATESSYLSAASSLSMNKTDEAVAQLEKLKSNPIIKAGKGEELYLLLVDAYKKKGNTEKMLATLEEARKAYPTNAQLTNEELNYYITAGKQDILVSKLEEAVAKDPKNAELQYNLGITYDNLANPKDKDGKELPKPAKADEYTAKSMKAYQTAIELQPDNPDVNYNVGVVYFNKAVEINNQMNKITGTSSAEIKKFDEMKVQRNKVFEQSLPYLEKATKVLEGKSAADLTPNLKDTYQRSLFALREVYTRLDKLDQAAATKKKLDTLK
jgi:Tfp pilus assembly protein PilF